MAISYIFNFTKKSLNLELTKRKEKNVYELNWLALGI